MGARPKGDAIALNAARIGHRYAPYRYEVSREKIREYARAVGFTDPQYEADRGEVIAPPTFPACFTVIHGGARLFEDPELGAHLALVHGGQEYELHRPLRAGDVLECTPWIADITTRRSNELLTLQVDCVDEVSGDPAVTSRGVIVFLGSAPQDGDGATQGG